MQTSVSVITIVYMIVFLEIVEVVLNSQKVDISIVFGAIRCGLLGWLTTVLGG